MTNVGFEPVRMRHLCKFESHVRHEQNIRRHQHWIAVGDTWNLCNPSTKIQPHYLSHSYLAPFAISVLLAQPTCCEPRSVRYKSFRPFHAAAFFEFLHLIRNLYRYSKPYRPHHIVQHTAPFHPMHIYAVHYPAPPAHTLQTYTVSNNLSDTLEPSPYYFYVSKLNHACTVRPNYLVRQTIVDWSPLVKCSR